MAEKLTGGQGFALAELAALSNGNAIRSAREGLNVSQAALAREADMPESFLAQVESGEIEMSEEATTRLWAALKILDENFQKPTTVRLEADAVIVTESGRVGNA